MTANETIANATFEPGVALTVLRMIGEYVITPSANTVAADSAIIGVGIGIISTDAFAVGGASLPDPLTDEDFPWLYWKEHPFEFAGAAESSASLAVSVRVSFDIRSMRKMKPKQTLAFVTQYGDVAGAPPLVVHVGSTRVLVGR